MNSKRYRGRKGGTRRRHSSSSSLAEFQKEIAVVFLEMLMMVKLFHWKTTSYATHKATDELYTKLNASTSLFNDSWLDKSTSFICLLLIKSIRDPLFPKRISIKLSIFAFNFV